VYISRIQRGNTNFAANRLGARGVLLSVLAHFFENGRWGSEVETGVDEQSLSGEAQLFILMQTAQYLTATRGFAAPDAQICYGRVASLCHSLGRSRPLYVALVGEWRYSLMTEKLTATMQIANRIYSLAEEQNDAALMMGAYRSLAVTFYFLGDFESSRQHAMSGAQIWRSKGEPSPVEEPIAPAVTCSCHQALSEWHLGEIASCQATMAEAITLAKELNDMHALAQALWYAAVLAHYERSPGEVERYASDLIELSTLHNFATWLAHADVLSGWVRSACGDTAEGISWIEDGLKDTRATGVMLTVPFLLALKAEALHLAGRTAEALEAIREGGVLVERFETRYWSAELHRLRGVFLAAMSADDTQIEASFGEAIRIAQEQKSVSLEKRAERTYAQYRRQKASGSGGRGVRLPLW
jgi:predicted ATPase